MKTLSTHNFDMFSANVLYASEPSLREWGNGWLLLLLSFFTSSFFYSYDSEKNQVKGWPAHPLIFYKDCMIILIEIDDCRGYNKKKRKSKSLGWGEEMRFGVESYIERLDFHLNDAKQHFSLHHYIRIKEGICYLYQIKYMMYGANLTHAATLRAYIIFI